MAIVKASQVQVGDTVVRWDGPVKVTKVISDPGWTEPNGELCPPFVGIYTDASLMADAFPPDQEIEIVD